MGGGWRITYGVGAVATLAAAFVGYFMLSSPRLQAPLSESGVVFPEGESVVPVTMPPAEKKGEQKKEDSILAEIDGRIQVIRLPGGEQRSVDLPAKPLQAVMTARYQGLDPSLQQPGAPFLWFHNSSGKMIFGRMVAADGRDTAPVYACDTETHACQKTAVDSSQAGGQGDVAVVPRGAVSQTEKYLVTVAQHDIPYIETGTRWDLLVYAADHLNEPQWTINISAAIDRSPETGYDSVSSVAWSPDEERVAVASSWKIVIADIRSGSVTSVFKAPAPVDEDTDPAWDNSALVWSPSGRYIAFASYSEAAGASEVSDEEAVADVLTIIDLEQGNAVKALVRAKSVRLIGDE